MNEPVSPADEVIEAASILTAPKMLCTAWGNYFHQDIADAAYEYVTHELGDDPTIDWPESALWPMIQALRRAGYKL